MIYLLVGNKKQRKEKTAEICCSNVTTNIHHDDLKETDLAQLTTTQTGMFGDLEYYIIYNHARDLKKDKLEEYRNSQNIFIFSEDTVTKPVRSLFEKLDAKIAEFIPEPKLIEKKFNIFSLTDSFANKDKKNLWLLFQEARKKSSPEEIHGVLFWQLKNLVLVKTSPTNPGLKDFVYSKTKKSSEKFSKKELLELSEKFLQIFHKRDSYSTLDIEIEKIILSL